MKTSYLKYVKMPVYALPYLVNGDASGLEPDDIQTIDAGMRFYENIAKLHGGSLVIAPAEDEAQFTWKPEFGLPCDVIETSIMVLVEDNSKFVL